MPTSTNLGFTYPTPLDPATADLWGDTLNTIFVLLDSEAATKTIALNFADKVLSRPIFKDEATKVNALGNKTGATTVDITLGNICTMTLTGNITLTISNPSPTSNYCYLILLITQDATGGRTVTFPAACKNTAGSNFSISGTTASTMTEVFMYTTDAGGTWRCKQGSTWV